MTRHDPYGCAALFFPSQAQISKKAKAESHEGPIDQDRVLPVRFDVARAGRSYRFVRPPVLDEETRVTFTYKTK